MWSRSVQFGGANVHVRTHTWLPFLNKSGESHWGPCFLRLWGNASKDTKEMSTKRISSAHDDTVDPFPSVCRIDLRTFQIELGCLYLLNKARIFWFLQPNVTQWRREVWVLCDGLDSPNLLYCQRCSRSEARELTFSYILLSQKMMPTHFLQIEEDLYEAELHREKKILIWNSYNHLPKGGYDPETMRLVDENVSQEREAAPLRLKLQSC